MLLLKALVDNPELEKLSAADLLSFSMKQAEEIRQLKEIQGQLLARVRRFITSFPFALIILKNDQSIKAVNKIALDYFQYEERELAKQPVTVLFPSVSRFDVTQPTMRIMGQKKNGELFATEAFVNALETEGEELLFVSVQDVDERHRLERLRRDLMAMITHDLRAPLTTLRVTLEMICEGAYGSLTERGRTLVDHGISSITYLNWLVESLLDSEKLERGDIELAYRETTVGKLVNRAINSTQMPTAVQLNLELNNDAITVDEDRIVQVLINLISNAAKYAPEDSKITVKGSIEGVSAKFEVADEGPGIPQEMQTVIFDRFKQLEQPGETRRQGFGLGLAICKSLVEKHGGQIWVESKGKGSRFCFVVPISPESMI